MEQENRRKRNIGFAVWLTIVFMTLFVCILAAFVFGKLQIEDKTILGGWGGTMLTILAGAAAYEWGSSKGSAMKDEMQAAAQRPQAGTTTDSTTTINTKTEPQETKP